MELIRKNDKIKVICGKDKGKTGVVLKVVGDKALVKGVNKYKKHLKPSQSNPNGSIIEKEMPIHKSNIMHCYGDACNVSRVGFKVVNNNKVRFLKKNGEILQDNKA